MRKITIFLALFCISTGAHAGLFEYYLGVETPSNETSNADTVEIIEEYQPVKNYKTYSSTYTNTYNAYPSYNNHYKQDNFYTDLTYPRKSYYDAIAHDKGFYRYNVIKDTLNDNLRRLEREADRIDDIKREIKLEISRLKKYSGSYYYDIRRKLEGRYDDLKYREREVEDLIGELEDDIKDLKKNKNRSKNAYYHYDGYFNIYDDYRYDRNSYNYYRSDYYYDHDEMRYRPSWVNPNLDSVTPRDIYIR